MGLGQCIDRTDTRSQVKRASKLYPFTRFLTSRLLCFYPTLSFVKHVRVPSSAQSPIADFLYLSTFSREAPLVSEPFSPCPSVHTPIFEVLQSSAMPLARLALRPCAHPDRDYRTYLLYGTREWLGVIIFECGWMTVHAVWAPFAGH